MKKIIIAIDGHSACGKSTLARDLATQLGYAYIDTGAMYRAVTLYFLQNSIPLDNADAILDALDKIKIQFRRANHQNRTILNEDDVENAIRDLEVSKMVSEVAALSAVRKDMVKQQQEMGLEKGIVMDGRDIGTVVFPKAELKLFLTANLDTRTERRLKELQEKGLEVDRLEIIENLRKRDYIDSTRADSPLRQAEDAVLIDNSNLTKEEQLEKALSLAMSAIDSY